MTSILSRLVHTAAVDSAKLMIVLSASNSTTNSPFNWRPLNLYFRDWKISKAFNVHQDIYMRPANKARFAHHSNGIRSSNVAALKYLRVLNCTGGQIVDKNVLSFLHLKCVAQLNSLNKRQPCVERRRRCWKNWHIIRGKYWRWLEIQQKWWAIVQLIWIRRCAEWKVNEPGMCWRFRWFLWVSNE